MIISAIVAKGQNDVIGRDNDLPWRLPKDLKWFKQQTSGHHVIMGRRSFESIGRPLPKRTNIIVTHDQGYAHTGVEVAHSITGALAIAFRAGETEVFILGGGKVYDQTKDIWDRLYLTQVEARPEGDTFFPNVDLARYQLAHEESHAADDDHAHAFSFYIYERYKALERDQV
ncbi:MAG: dihydrofolate reductase [Bacteroidota bacterium]